MLSKFAALGQMAGDIAHEINNPLTVIYGRARQICDEAAVGEELHCSNSRVKLHAEKIATTAMQLSKIVKSLKSLARNDEHDPFQDVKLKRIIEDAFELCMHRFKFNSILASGFEFSEDISIQCRPTQILQVLINLINNAIDALEAIDIGEQEKNSKWIRLSTLFDGDWIEIKITDSGPGISPENCEKIFDLFFTTKKAGKGTGVGLAICKKIMDAHGGFITVDSAAKNTTFILKLPKNQALN